VLDYRPHEYLSRVRRTASTLCLIGVLGAAVASSPEDALAYRSPELEVVQQRLLGARSELSFWEDLSYGATLKPSASYSDTFGDDLDAQLQTDLSAGADLNYRYRGSEVLERVERVLRLEDELEDMERGGVGTALLLHAALLAAQLEQRLAEAAFAVAQADVRAAENQPPADDPVLARVHQARLEASRLTLEEHRLSLQSAREELQALREEAARYNLRAPATYRALQFALPVRRAEQTAAYRLLELEVQQAGARLAEAPLDPFNALQLGAEYTAPDFGAKASVGIFKTEPGATLGVSYPGGEEGWELSLSAEIVLDENTQETFGDAEQELKEAEAALSAFVRSFPEELEAARAGVEAAWRSVALAERRLRLDESRILTLTEASEQLREALEVADEERERELEVQLRDLERELSRAPDERDRSEEVLYGSWRSYLSEVSSYLALVDERWRTR